MKLQSVGPPADVSLCSLSYQRNIYINAELNSMADECVCVCARSNISAGVQMIKYTSLKTSLWDESYSYATYDQVWWPILAINTEHKLRVWVTILGRMSRNYHFHLQNTHTRSSGQPFMLRCPGSSCGFGALLKSTSVVVLKVKRALVIHSPHLQSLPARDSNPQHLDYESDSLTIRPQLPRDVALCVFLLL